MRRNPATIAFFGLLLVLACGWVVAFPGPTDARQEAAEAKEAAAPTPPAAPDARPRDNMFMHILRSAGWLFGPLLLLLSIGLVAMIVLLAMDLRMVVAVPPAFVEEFTDTVNKRKFKEAYQMTQDDHSFLARVLAAGMSRLQYGIEDAREAALNAVESFKAGKEQLITYLATIGTLGPMIGLVGTVYGMIQSFMVLGRSGQTIKADELAHGISHALVVTLLGVALSIPAIFSHAFFRNRLIRLAMEVAGIADDLLTQMYHNTRRPVPASPVAAPADARAATAAAKPVE